MVARSVLVSNGVLYIQPNSSCQAREWKSLDPLPHARSMQSTIADDAVSYVTAPQH
jgi:hypothetical protein